MACAMQRQLHASTPCVLGTTFGCDASDHSMWVAGGCRGVFDCHGEPTAICGLRHKPIRVRCSCLSDRNPRKHELNSAWSDAAEDEYAMRQLGKRTDGAAMAELAGTARHNLSTWWASEQQSNGDADPSVQASHHPGEAPAPLRDVSCVGVEGIAHGYGAYLSTAIHRAWSVELEGHAPVIRLPSWLPQPSSCTTEELLASSTAAHESPSPQLHRISSLLSAPSCAHLAWPCVGMARRGCHAPGALTSRWGLWSERLAQARPTRPLPGAPYWYIAEYIASTLRPNAAFESLLLAPLLPPSSLQPTLAVHMRYGDSCTAREAFRTARRCSPVDDYVVAARRMASRYGFRSILLSSDSSRATREFRRRWGERTPIFDSGVSGA